MILLAKQREVTKVKQKYELLELAIENEDLDLFFQGSRIYFLGENKFYPLRNLLWLMKLWISFIVIIKKP